jgi:hypothetical protein
MITLHTRVAASAFVGMCAVDGRSPGQSRRTLEAGTAAVDARSPRRAPLQPPATQSARLPSTVRSRVYGEGRVGRGARAEPEKEGSYGQSSDGRV